MDPNNRILTIGLMTIAALMVMIVISACLLTLTSPYVICGHLQAIGQESEFCATTLKGTGLKQETDK